jgi:hypothetical protein
MKTRVLMATVGAAAAALAASVMWTAPSASAGTDYCNALPTPQQGGIVKTCGLGALGRGRFMAVVGGRVVRR